MYVVGYVTAVPKKNKKQYLKLAQKLVPLFLKHGATRVADCWQSEVPHGSVDFFKAVKAKSNEHVVLSWLEYPSRAARKRAEKTMNSDAEITEIYKHLPYNEKRIISGDFVSIMDSDKDLD